MTVQQALPLIAKILLKAQEEMKDKKQELELSVLCDENNYVHKILDRAQVDLLTQQAQLDIENEQLDMAWL